MRVLRSAICGTLMSFVLQLLFFKEFYKMVYRKFNATQLFDGYKLYDDQQVLITTEEGTIESIVPVSEAGDDIQTLDGILTPGFINCHCHLELSHMKGKIPETTGLVDFVVAVVQQRHFPDEEILSAIDKAEEEMRNSGIIAVGDICNNGLTIKQKIKGNIYYHNFIEASGFNPVIAQQRFDRSLEFFNEYAKHYEIPIDSNSITPHAPYSVANELWDKLISFPGNHLFTIHNQETPGEDEWFIDKKGDFSSMYEKMNIDTSFFQATGKSSLQSFLSRFLHCQQLLLVHNVYTKQADIDFSKQAVNAERIYWCLCPNANWYISRQTPDIDLFMKNGCRIVLGTDSLASNWQLSISEEIKTIHKHFPLVKTEDLLSWATINGAKALQMDNLLGSFEKGKRPGIVLCDTGFTRSERIL